MRQILCCFLLLAMLCLPERGVCAEAPPLTSAQGNGLLADKPLQALVVRLDNWVATALHVPAARNPMAIVTSSNRYRQALLVTSGRVHEARFIQLPGAMIFDTDEVDTENPVIQSQIIHALVHHHQFLNKHPFDCPEQREHEAYTLQNRWLEEQGERPYLSANTLARWEHCPVATPAAVAEAAPPPVEPDSSASAPKESSEDEIQQSSKD